MRKFGIFVWIMASALFPAIAAESPEGGRAEPSAAAPAPETAADWRDKVVVLEVKGAILPKPFSDMPEKLAAALDKADADKARLVVLEIDSPGGDVDACDRLSKRIFESETPVVALVVHKGISGAAMLAAAAREIVMTDSARLGDIQPMRSNMVTGETAPMDERTAEKIEVDIRKILRVYAERHKRPEAVFDSMVSRKYTLYDVRLEDGGRLFLTRAELGLHEENIEKGRETRKIASSRLIKNEGDLLMLTAQEAVDYGIASEKVRDAGAFRAGRGIDPEDVVTPEIPEGTLDLSKFLPSIDDLGIPVPVLLLLGVFLVIGLTGLVTEFYSPGLGIPGVIGVIGLVSFFGLLLMYDRGSPAGIAIFILGVILLVVEIAVLPGFGVAGVAGALGILLGIGIAFMPDLDSGYLRENLWNEVGSLSLLLLEATILTGLAVWLVSRFGQNAPFLRYFALGQAIVPTAAQAPDAALTADDRESRRRILEAMPGRAGVAETMLRPAGKMRLDSGELLDVVTDGTFVDPGQRVIVSEATPARIVVKPVSGKND